MKALLALAYAIDWLNIKVGKAVTWLILLAVIVSAGNAIVRKLFSVSSNAWLELQWYLFGAVFLLAGGYTLYKNEHVRVDVLSQRFSKKTRIWVEIMGVLLFILPTCIVMFWLSWPIFLDSFISQEQSSNAGGLIRWPAKLLIPVGFGLFILAALSHLIKCLAWLRGCGSSPLDEAAGLTAEQELAQEILQSKVSQQQLNTKNKNLTDSQ